MGVRFINYSVIGFSISLVIGIVAGHLMGPSLQKSPTPLSLFIVLASLVALLCILYLLNRRKLYPFLLYDILVYVFFIGLGFTHKTLELPAFNSSHFYNFQENGEPPVLQLKIKTVLKPDRYYTKYLAKVIALNEKETSGKVLVYLQADAQFANLTVDKTLLVVARPNEIALAKNPYQFEYATYMKNQGVYHEVRIQQRDILRIVEGNTTLTGFSEKLRTYLVSKLKQSKLDTEERSILQALVLGERRDIDSQLYADYAAAGAIHILAVSGLHVGILCAFLLFIGTPLLYLRFGPYIRSMLVITLLWCFAFLAGFSPSVVRAVTMFSFFAFGTMLQRATYSFNTLFLSFFVLLLVRPNWLFHVGFQLSYLAVFFILWIQPKLFKSYRPRYYIGRLLWGIITVTLAAQIGVLPLSLYYFHQFPGLFFLTNIIVLPFLGLLLVGGILVVVLAALNVLPPIIAESYNMLLFALNSCIQWIARQDTFLFQDIPFSKGHVMASYLVIIFSTLLWSKFTGSRLMTCLASYCLFIGLSVFDKRKQAHTELIVFHKNRHSLIGYKENEHLTVFKNDTMPFEFPVRGYRMAKRIGSYSEQKIPSFFYYKDHPILVLDSLGVYPKNLDSTIVVLTQSPKIHLERLIKDLDPLLIVADGSNFTSYVNRWRETCGIKKLPFHHTGTKGAITLK